MNVVELKNISKSYKRGTQINSVLSNINLCIGKNDFLVIMGKSGCGKTTLLNIIGCVSKPDKGEFYFEGKSMVTPSDKDVSYYRNHIGFVVQNYGLINDMKVFDLIAMPLVYRGSSGNIIKKKVIDIVEKLGIKDKLKKYPYELSGGECQRVAIARALIVNPSLILADEPTGALDEKNSRIISDILVDINKIGIPIVMVTHDSNMAKIGKKIVHMKDGCI